MFFVADTAELILDSLDVIYVAEFGSDTPHTAIIDGEFVDLIDPPTLPICATNEPVCIDDLL